MNKICNKCNVEKDISEFYKAWKKYYQSDCKLCTNIRVNKWRREHNENAVQYVRNWRIKHKNTNHLKAWQILEWMTKRSKDRWFPPPEWTRDEIYSIIEWWVCSKTWIPFEFSQSKYRKSPFTPTPDRIDSSLGYTKENTQWVCYMYNAMKWEFSVDDVDRFISGINNYGNF